MSLESTISNWRNDGHSIVFTNGVFDILHVGHLHCLEQAKSHGAKLIVGINDDKSVKALGKGDNRPVHSQEDRATLLKGLSCVDEVVVFTQDTPLELINAIKPDVLIKGGDYDETIVNEKDPKYIVGSLEVKSWGGKVLTIDLLPGHSTTNILNSFLF